MDLLGVPVRPASKLNDVLDAGVVVFLAYVGSSLRELLDGVGIHAEVVYVGRTLY
jgi:hypothetical protein